MKTILLLLVFNYFSYSQEYVTPDELEEGWGFGYDYEFGFKISQPKNVINEFAVSPDNNRIIISYKVPLYSDNDKHIIYDLQNKSISNFPISPYQFLWLPNSEILFFIDKFDNQKKYLNFNDFKIENFCNFDCNDEFINYCNFGSQIIEENNEYFTYSYFRDSLIFKLNLTKTLNNKCPEFFVVDSNNTIDYQQFIPFWISYPPNQKNIFVHRKFSENKEGFSIIRNFNALKYIDIKAIKDFEFNELFEIRGNNMLKRAIIDDYDNIICFLSFRTKSEIYHSKDYILYDDPEALEARNASGWYRLDTNGQNAVQLVRSWPYNPGGLQISGDGETLYYAYILPDSTSTIMKMDRFGKNKEIVFRLDPEILNVEKQSIKPQIYPNPANETVTISGIEQGKIEIYDTLGKLLLTQDFLGQSQIDVSKFKTGIYIVKLESDGIVKFEKLLISK